MRRHFVFKGLIFKYLPLTPTLPMNLKVASLIINNLRSFRFQGFNARILRGILPPFGGGRESDANCANGRELRKRKLEQHVAGTPGSGTV